MGARIARTLLRAVGWLLTPVVITLAALLGATLLALLAPRFSTSIGLLLTAAGGLLGAGLAFWGWMRILQHSRGLRQALQLSGDGTPLLVDPDGAAPSEAETHHIAEAQTAATLNQENPPQ